MSATKVGLMLILNNRMSYMFMTVFVEKYDRNTLISIYF